MQTKFKGFTVTDFAALKAAFPRVVEMRECISGPKVRTLLDLGVPVPGVVVTADTPVDNPVDIPVIPDSVKVISAVKYDGNGNAAEIPVDDVVIPKFMNKKAAALGVKPEME